MDEIVARVVLKAAEVLFGADMSNFKVLEVRETSYGYSCHLCLSAPIEFEADGEAVLVEPHIAFVKLYPRKNAVRPVFNFSYARFRSFPGKLGRYEFVMKLSPDVTSLLKAGGGDP